LTVEKLAVPLTVKVTEEMASDLRLLAQARQMEVAEYIRHLISEDKQALRRQWETLNEVFSIPERNARDTKSNLENGQ